MTGDFNALTLSHRFIREHVRSGNFCIDATAGRGRDTALLCRMVGETGRVLAFDVQQEALDSTALRLEEEGLSSIAELILDSHHNMGRYAPPDSVDCIVFNLGWLPGGDHAVYTRAETSIAAILAGLGLLRVGGVMSLCLYYGGDSGFAERDALFRFLPTLDSMCCTVLVSEFVNRPNNPSIPVFIYKDA